MSAPEMFQEQPKGEKKKKFPDVCMQAFLQTAASDANSISKRWAAYLFVVVLIDIYFFLLDFGLFLHFRCTRRDIDFWVAVSPVTMFCVLLESRREVFWTAV